MTNTGPARPPDRHIAGFGELQNAFVGRCFPVRSDATARERHNGTGFGVVPRWMRRSARVADDTRRHRLAAVEQFDMNPLRRQSQRCERPFHVSHEASRPAQVDVRFSWYADRVEHRSRQMTGRVEMLGQLVARTWPAVADIATGVREREHQLPDLCREWMMLPIPSPVQP